MQTKSPLGAKITPVLLACMWGYAPWSWVVVMAGSTQRDHPGAESTMFLCNDLIKRSAISADSSCSFLVFRPTCSLGDVDDNYVLYLKQLPMQKLKHRAGSVMTCIKLNSQTLKTRLWSD